MAVRSVLAAASGVELEELVRCGQFCVTDLITECCGVVVIIAEIRLDWR